MARLVETAPQVRLIVTSRARLNITAECTYEVPPMVFPTEPTEEVFEEFEAVELFVSYARRAQPNYELAAEFRPAVVRLCQLIGGVPLGLELAAAWMRLLSPAEIADEVATNLDFLETDAHDVADRHRSLRAVFDYSWDLLPEAERDAFVRLSVFRGGFTREFAREVSGASLRTLLSLVDKSLITRQPDGRFQIHEYLRQYGENRLAADPQRE
ncbi:MAG: hypothetical protein ACFB51_17900 [Anaerolineae bacterium]